MNEVFTAVGIGHVEWYWVIVIRSSITLDPKTIAKQACVSKYAASDTSEGAQLFRTQS